MDTSFHLLPPQASEQAVHVDHVMLFLTVVSAFFTLLIATLVVTFAIKYRRRAPGEHPIPPQAPDEKRHAGLALEITWTAIPLVIVAAMFLMGARGYMRTQQPPVNAEEVYVLGKRWMWKVQHPTGAREINEIHVPIGKPVRLIMISQDVIHDFGMPAFRVKHDVLPERFTSQWFTATQPGTYRLYCNQYCGTDHAKMVGLIYAMEPDKYQQWLDGRPADDAMRTAGEKLFAQYGCVTCHATRAPTMAGLFGRSVPLEGGTSALADENYLRESILYPSAKIHAGYPPIMPSFHGQLTDEQVNALVAYIKSMANATTTPNDPFQLPPTAGPATQPDRARPGPGVFEQTLEPRTQP